MVYPHHLLAANIGKGRFIIYGMGGHTTRGGEEFWTRREGGAKNFGQAVKGGRKILDLVNFFSMFLKHNFFMFCGYFGHF